MAKTYNNLFEQVVSFDALYAAYVQARKGKREKLHCAKFENRLEYELIHLQNELILGEYKVGGYRSFYVHEPKLRKITALRDFRDRVVQNAIYAAIEPIWESRFIYDSYACRVNKGTHIGVDRAQSFLKAVLKEHGKIYALKADIAKYFSSIDHEILKSLLRKRIADKKLMVVIEDIIDSYSESSGKGIPIGNLTSQLFANIYLDHFDQWIKNRKGVKYYARYMDDFIVIHHDKSYLIKLRMEAEAFLHDELRLYTNHKTQVFPVAHKCGRGLDFLGTHLWPDGRRMRKCTINRVKRRLKVMQKQYARNEIELSEIRASVLSTVAHARHSGGVQAVSKLLSKHTFRSGE